MNKFAKILISIIGALLVISLFLLVVVVKLFTVIFAICFLAILTFCVGFLIYEKLNELF